MIKRVGNIVIMVLLLIATGGIPVTRHYCGPAEISFSFYSTPKPCCNNHCDKCHNIYKFSKVNDAFETGSTVSSPFLYDSGSVQFATYIVFFDNLQGSYLPDLINQRKFLIAGAGHSPASFGNFRC